MSDTAAIADQLAAATVLHQRGDLAGAERLYRDVVDREPENAEALHLLGVVALQGRRHEEAVELIRAAIGHNAGKADYHSNLSIPLRELGRHPESLEAATRAVALRDSYPGAHANRGLALMALHRYEEAAAAFGRAIALQPNLAGFHNNLGNAQRAIRDFEAAEASYRRAIELQPSHAHALFGLGVVLDEQERRLEALAALKRAVALDGRFGEAWRRMGGIYTDSGLPEEAVEAFRRALEIDPDDIGVLIANVATKNYLDDAEPTDILARAREFSERLVRKAGPVPRHVNVPDPERRLRIGFVSGDLGDHPVGEFTRSVLAAIDRSEFELFAYASRRLRNPMQDQFSVWRYIDSLPPSQAIGLIAKDGIDILIDLAGYTVAGCPEVFAARPAPVQTTWLGYSGTTGNPRIDYIIADHHIIPPAEAHLYSEEPWRLPDSYLCWTPPAADVPVAPLPALESGNVTFGSFNNVRKVSLATARTWARVLHAVPGSTILLKSSGGVDPIAYARVEDLLAAEGIARERIAFVKAVPSKEEHYAHYNRVDIALDPFPYNGTTTTVEALWMGVPLITLAGDRFIARVGESILTTLGEPGWIAADAEGYVRKAVALASDLSALAEVRARLRPQLLASPLCDAPRFARNLEAAWRGMWRRWCDAQQAAT